MRSKISLLAILSALICMGCQKDSLPLTQEKGIWRETNVVRRLFENNVQTDSLTQNEELATYRFRDNGRGTYTLGTNTVDLEWSLDTGDTLLNICLDNGGLLQCNLHTVQHIDQATQTWITRNDFSANAYELVTTDLLWQK